MPMRLSLGAFSRYCPRALTVVLLAAIVAAIWLANQIGDYRTRKYRTTAYPPPQSELQFSVEEPSEADQRGIWDKNLSYGWPLLWCQYVVEFTVTTGPFIIAQNYSPARLAGNLAIWLVMLAAPAGACEWLLRRYRPGWRFSLRTLLVATALAAALCAWFAAARNRADVEDRVIDSINLHGGRVWCKRWGPNWLEHIVVERLCRRIVGARVDARPFYKLSDEECGRLLSDLSRLPDLQYLSLSVEKLTPEIIAALRELRQLETLEFEINQLTPEAGQALAAALGGMRRLRALEFLGHGIFDDGTPHECLAAVGDLSQLEHLDMVALNLAGDDLALLAGLTSLKSLTLQYIDADRPASVPALLSKLPPLANLEALDLEGSSVSDRDLRYIARLQRLKSLNLLSTEITGATLAELASHGTLEELGIGRFAVSPDGLKSLHNWKQLKKLHIGDFNMQSFQSRDALRDALRDDLTDDEIDGCVRAFAELRKEKPGLVVDDGAFVLEHRLAPNDKDNYAYSQNAILRQAVQAWKDNQASQAAGPGAVNRPREN